MTTLTTHIGRVEISPGTFGPAEARSASSTHCVLVEVGNCAWGAVIKIMPNIRNYIDNSNSSRKNGDNLAGEEEKEDLS